MARKISTRKTARRPGLFVRFKAFITGDKLKYTLGLFFFLFSIYLLVAFVSFLFTGHADHSRLDLSWRDLVSDPSIQVENKAGKTGAFLSEFFMNRGFGLASFLFVYMLVVTAFQLWGRPLVKFGKAILFSLILLFLISVSMGLALTLADDDRYLYLGGENGLFISNWLSSMFGSIGTFFILASCLFLILVVRVDSFTNWLNRIFARKVKEPVTPDTASAEKPVSAATVVTPQESISRQITEHDVIETDFDPDADELEIEERIDISPVTRHVQDQMGIAGNGHEGPEMTVEKTEEEQDEDFMPDGGAMEAYDPTLDLSNYKFPPIELLDDHPSGNAEVSNEELISNKNKIVETLRHYKIEITKIRATIGPTITLYEIVPAPGIRIAKIKNLEDDIALSLSALGIRIIAPIPGRGTIGIEVPNQQPEIVSMRSIIASKKFQESPGDLPVVLGKTISNETFLIDLTKMPHILVAGATGQGKSVGLNAIITSLLYKKHPSQLKLVMIDPKKVELSLYSTIEKHFLAKLPDDEEPIITDIQKVKYTLNSLNVEMDSRYELLKKAHARNIKEYNVKFTSRRLNPEKGHRFLPYIVVIIDEFADLIMTAGKEIELPIARIAQLARAVGIHMIIATQRPSTNIITGVIKANFPTRIAFKVASMIDSRTILDTPGANQLIGKGDMLISMGSTMTRLQCAFVDTPEIERICEYISEQQGYPSAFMLPEYVGDNEGAGGLSEADLGSRDELFDEAARVVVMNQMGSTSMIQRKFSIGYNRAGRIMDQLEAAGIVGPSEGSKARQVMIQDEYSLEQLLKNN
ncbi:MAG: DNA translocase FtsK 4TM domain-containing protein [Mangrovibacterium sp.]